MKKEKKEAFLNKKNLFDFNINGKKTYIKIYKKRRASRLVAQRFINSTRSELPE